jgi:hypothetical protein
MFIEVRIRKYPLIYKNCISFFLLVLFESVSAIALLEQIRCSSGRRSYSETDDGKK